MHDQDKTRAHQWQACAGDSYCGCRLCLDELAAERERNGWRAEWFGLPASVAAVELPELAAWRAAS